MRILIIGGTRFVGRHLVQSLVDAGHSVELANRGNSAPDLFGDLPLNRIDRRGDVSALESAGPWDAVVDVCGYVEEDMRALLDALAGRFDRYLYVSTISVYAPGGGGFLDESSPLLPPLAVGADTSDMDPGDRYGMGKVACELYAGANVPEEALTIVRPGIVTGPFDPTRRYDYYVSRAMSGGRFAVPGDPSRPLQLIDGRDLAAFMRTLLEGEIEGTFDAAGNPPTLHGGGQLTFGAAINAAIEAVVAAGVDRPEPVWIDGSHSDVDQLPLAYELNDLNARSMLTLCMEQAQCHGLTLRPLVETAGDMVNWLRDDPAASSDESIDASLLATSS